MEDEFDQRLKNIVIINWSRKEWPRAGIIQFDEMSVNDKLVFNAHIMELVGYMGGAINNDVIST